MGMLLSNTGSLLSKDILKAQCPNNRLTDAPEKSPTARIVVQSFASAMQSRRSAPKRAEIFPKTCRKPQEKDASHPAFWQPCVTVPGFGATAFPAMDEVSRLRWSLLVGL